MKMIVLLLNCLLIVFPNNCNAQFVAELQDNYCGRNDIYTEYPYALMGPFRPFTKEYALQKHLKSVVAVGYGYMLPNFIRNLTQQQLVNRKMASECNGRIQADSVGLSYKWDIALKYYTTGNLMGIDIIKSDCNTGATVEKFKQINEYTTNGMIFKENFTYESDSLQSQDIAPNFEQGTHEKKYIYDRNNNLVGYSHMYFKSIGTVLSGEGESFREWIFFVVDTVYNRRIIYVNYNRADTASANPTSRIVKIVQSKKDVPIKEITITSERSGLETDNTISFGMYSNLLSRKRLKEKQFELKPGFKLDEADYNVRYKSNVERRQIKSKTVTITTWIKKTGAIKRVQSNKWMISSSKKFGEKKRNSLIVYKYKNQMINVNIQQNECLRKQFDEKGMLESEQRIRILPSFGNFTRDVTPSKPSVMSALMWRYKWDESGLLQQAMYSGAYNDECLKDSVNQPLLKSITDKLASQKCMLCDEIPQNNFWPVNQMTGLLLGRYLYEFFKN